MQDQQIEDMPAQDMPAQAEPDVQDADPTPDTVQGVFDEVDVEVSRSFQDMLTEAQDWGLSVLDQLLSLSSLWQLLAILLAAILGFILSRGPKQRVEAMRAARKPDAFLHKAYNAIAGIMWPLFVVLLLWLATFIFSAAGLPSNILRIAASLTNAAIIVRLLTRNMEAGPLRTLIAITAWGVAALYILNLLDPLTGALDSAALSIGGTRISILDVLTSFILAIAALWIGRILGDAAQSSLRSSPRLTPSMSGLLGQVAKIGLMILAVIIALQSIGIPLTAFAVVSGAIGVGIGFGLQSIFSNFISGIIILFEKSIKVGDFIELQSGVRGQVKELNIRSTLVTTNDSVDILVPNEEFIKAQVINWTLRDPRRRLRVPFGVAYGTDKEVVRKAALEAAEAVEWTVKEPGKETQVWLVEFGDSSLNYELVVWLNDRAVKRPGRVMADYNWALHTALEAYELEIPFPQRDLNLRAPAEITVRMAEKSVKTE
ncbi:mechanosensitive ion channel family protein [Algimonas porphyrae]|uniref:Mechanosensitive ion channel protein n=1 Tax=Algimonas porphyrae TaxID=1128113 RepID=A0ABQ5V1A1_9PROT|nr:mechanosensitive ion channel domain-containing protein [Algimonas porphyrae]GLQ20717.1 mechanosensitive ion channel protein [Algimonas porphyrae]